MPAHLIAVLALYCCAAASATVVTFPSDVPVPGGQSVGAVCGDCCQAGSYCGVTSASKAMTCILRDRSVFGAVDGGLCVPGPLSVPIEDFCRAYKSDNAPPAAFKLSEIIYQAGLTTQKLDGSCCDGTHMCDALSKCRPVIDFKMVGRLTSPPKAVCIYSSATTDTSSKYVLDMSQEVLCETCDSLSQTAKATQDQQHFSSDHAAAPTSG